MKKTLLALVLLTQSASASPLDPVVFLQGCWGAPGEGGSRISETWLRSASDRMLGVSQGVGADGSSLCHEFLSISADASGGLVYQAIVGDNAPVSFSYDPAQSSSGPRFRAVFVNPSHDFPRSIAYRMFGGGLALQVTLTGEGEDGQPLEIVYELHRENCAAR
jgi:hypothetical protein